MHDKMMTCTLKLYNYYKLGIHIIILHPPIVVLTKFSCKKKKNVEFLITKKPRSMFIENINHSDGQIKIVFNAGTR